MKYQKIILTIAAILLLGSLAYYGYAKGTFSRSATPTTREAIAFSCVGDLAQDFDCYDTYYKSIVDAQDVATAFTDLKARYETDGYVKAQCHPLTHVIGRTAVAKYPKVSEAYTYGDPFCWSGYYHGALEGVIAKMGRKEVPNQLNTICADIAGKERYSFDYFNCVHGLGHGLMAYTNTELPDALALCDNLKGDWEKRSCYGGAFMENVIVDNKNHFTKWLKPEDPLYPCPAVAEKYRLDCYLMQTSYMLKVTGNDFKKVFGLCATTGDAYRPTCYQSLGRDASGQNSSNAEFTKMRCMLGQDDEARSNCVIGAVKDFISYFHSFDQAKVFCNSLDNDLSGLCLDMGEQYYNNL